jgi:hypothetical protein
MARQIWAGCVVAERRCDGLQVLRIETPIGSTHDSTAAVCRPSQRRSPCRPSVDGSFPVRSVLEVRRTALRALQFAGQ